MTVYIDSNFLCHVSAGEGRTAAESGFFDGKCDAFIQGYRFVPQGQSWTRGDGQIFHGEMIAPAEDCRRLFGAQEQYELDDAAHTAEMAELVEMVYEADLEVIG